MADPLAGLHTNMRVFQAGCAMIPTTNLVLIVDLNWIFSSSKRRHAQSMHAHQERRYLSYFEIMIVAGNEKKRLPRLLFPTGRVSHSPRLERWIITLLGLK